MKTAEMIDSKLLNELSNRLSRLLPGEPGVLRQDLENNIRAALQGAFQKLDLVTREEFGVQAEVLARTRSRLEALEKRLEALEQQSGGNGGDLGSLSPRRAERGIRSIG
jgi:BMFP domain-containing protein YqiC